MSRYKREKWNLALPEKYKILFCIWVNGGPMDGRKKESEGKEWK